jgi:hypothetical protein
MEIYEVEEPKPSSKLQQIFLTRLYEFIKNTQPQKIEENYNDQSNSLVTITCIGVIFTTLFSLTVAKIGFVYALLIVFFLLSIIIVYFVYHI